MCGARDDSPSLPGPLDTPPAELGADIPQSELDLAERKGTGQTVRLLMFGLGNERAIDRRSKSEVNHQGRAVRWVYSSSLFSLTPPFLEVIEAGSSMCGIHAGL